MICLDYFFPPHPVEGTHASAIKLRRIIVNLIVGHIACLIFSLSFVSILTALA
jgi:hypothetical protein